MPSNCTLPGWLVWPVNHVAIKLLQQPRKPLAEPCSHWPARACAGALAKVTGLGGQPAGPGGGRLPWGWGADQVGAGSLSPCPLRLVAGRWRGGVSAASGDLQPRWAGLPAPGGLCSSGASAYTARWEPDTRPRWASHPSPSSGASALFTRKSQLGWGGEVRRPPGPLTQFPFPWGEGVPIVLGAWSPISGLTHFLFPG